MADLACPAASRPWGSKDTSGTGDSGSGAMHGDEGGVVGGWFSGVGVGGRRAASWAFLCQGAMHSRLKAASTAARRARQALSSCSVFSLCQRAAHLSSVMGVWGIESFKSLARRMASTRWRNCCSRVSWSPIVRSLRLPMLYQRVRQDDHQARIFPFHLKPFSYSPLHVCITLGCRHVPCKDKRSIIYCLCSSI